MTVKRRYQIVRQYPLYDQITDGLIGSGFVRQENAYESRAYAMKLAAKLTDDNHNHGGDDIFFIVPWGGDIFRDRQYGPVADIEIPF